MSGSRIGITGHSRLTDLTHELVAAALRGLLADARPLVGVTCLAQGSDHSSLTWCWSWVAIWR